MTKQLLLAFLTLAAPGLSWGQIVSYEASFNLFPERVGMGWTRIIQPYQSDRWLSNGWLVQYSEQVQGKFLEEEQDAYRRNFPEQAGLPTWFLQFRVITDTPPVYSDVGPAAIAASGTSGVNYHFTIGDSQFRFLRNVDPSQLYVDIQPGVPHTYRLELRGVQSYTLWIDSIIIESDVPAGPYPVTSSFVTFRGQASAPVNTTMWRYVRFGRIPIDGSGDYDSNGMVDQTDLFYFVDCLLGPDYDASGPSSKWADMNKDGVANGADVQAFVSAMVGS
jgi:hypothetical protein